MSRYKSRISSNDPLIRSSNKNLNILIKAVFFDFMGTCLDWHGSVTSSFPTTISQAQASELALAWRHTYFAENNARIAQGLPVEDIDITHARTFDGVLADKFPALKPSFDNAAKQAAIRAFHDQTAWPDVAPALTRLRQLGYEVFVHANGTTRLQLDLVASSKLSFDMLFNSEVLGLYMPATEAYHKALHLIKARPEEVVKVAAHVSDLRGAKEAGMMTVYVHRWTDDVNEDVQQIRGEFDVFLEDMEGLVQTIQEKFP